MLAIINGADSYWKITTFIKIHSKALKKKYKLLLKKMPGYCSVGNILQRTNKEELERVFSALLGSEIILAHETIEAKTNEIPVAQKFSEELDIKNHVFTLDALHCQKNFLPSKEIMKRRGDTAQGKSKEVVTINLSEFFRNGSFKAKTEGVDSYKNFTAGFRFSSKSKVCLKMKLVTCLNIGR